MLGFWVFGGNRLVLFRASWVCCYEFDGSWCDVELIDAPLLDLHWGKDCDALDSVASVLEVLSLDDAGGVDWGVFV